MYNASYSSPTSSWHYDKANFIVKGIETMKNKKAIAILSSVAAGILLVVGIFHLLGKDILWGGADVAAAIIVFVILGIIELHINRLR